MADDTIDGGMQASLAWYRARLEAANQQIGRLVEQNERLEALCASLRAAAAAPDVRDLPIWPAHPFDESRLSDVAALDRATAGLDDTGFVTVIYRRFLMRDPDEAGLHHHLRLIGEAGRAEVAAAVHASAEADVWRALRADPRFGLAVDLTEIPSTREFVRLVYAMLLQREPEPAALAFLWTRTDTPPLRIEALVATARSVEARQRATPLAAMLDEHGDRIDAFVRGLHP